MKEINYDECNEDVFAAKKEDDNMFLTTSKFKFLDVKNYIASGLSYDAWCKSMGCRLEKLMFPYEWLDSYDNNTILIKLMYVKAQLVSQVHQWHTRWTSPWKKQKA